MESRDGCGYLRYLVFVKMRHAFLVAFLTKMELRFPRMHPILWHLCAVCPAAALTRYAYVTHALATIGHGSRRTWSSAAAGHTAHKYSYVTHVLGAIRTPSPRASMRMGDVPESTVQAETNDDEAWAAIDAWLEKRHDAPPKAESRPQRTRHRWTCTSKGHVHDTFLATGTKSWEALGASPRLTANLEALGFARPSCAQALSFEPMRRHQDVLLADASGCGKTLAYVAPLVERLWEIEASEGRTPPGQVRALVIVPTSDLAQQVVELAREVGHHSLRVSLATGEHSWATQRERLGGGLEVLVATMGRLMAHLSPRDRPPSVSLEGVRMLVVDEASSLYQGRDSTRAPSVATRPYIPGAVGTAGDVGTRKAEEEETAGDSGGGGGGGMPRLGHAPPPQDVGSEQLPLASFRWLLRVLPAGCATALVTTVLPEGVEDQMQLDVPGLVRRVRPGLHRTRAGVPITLVDCTQPLNAQHSAFEAKLEELTMALVGAQHALVLCDNGATCEALHRHLQRRELQRRDLQRSPTATPASFITAAVPALSVHLFHSSLPSARRSESLASFRAMPDPLAPIALGPEAPRLLVATGRVVRGLDLSRLPYLGLSAGSQPVDPKYGYGKPIDRVILFDFPSEAKAYLSRIGCATRGTAPPAPVTALVVGPQLAFARALLTHDEKGAPHALDKPAGRELRSNCSDARD